MKSFKEFWPFYLQEHANTTNRWLHFVGTFIVHILVVVAVVTGSARWLIAIPFAGYGFAWAGHFGVQKNRPATFKHPLWSLIADFKMFYLMLMGRLK